jgi:hypothetical protein
MASSLRTLLVTTHYSPIIGSRLLCLLLLLSTFCWALQDPFPSRENCESPFMDPSSGRISRDPPGIALDSRLIVFPKNRELLRFKCF